MRKIAANLIFPIVSHPIKNGYLVLDNNGTIVEIVDTQGEISEIAGLEYYSGILVPGMVICDVTNKNALLLNGWLESLSSEQKKWARYLFSRGIQAISDINLLTEKAKSFSFAREFNSQLATHSNFIEALNHLTLKNASVLNLHKSIGSFEPGKNSGVLLITGFDYSTFSLRENAKLKRLQ